MFLMILFMVLQTKKRGINFTLWKKSPYYLLQKLLLFIKLFFKQKYTKHKKYTTKVIGNKVSFVSIL